MEATYNTPNVLTHVFVQIIEYICSDYEMYLSKLQSEKKSKGKGRRNTKFFSINLETNEGRQKSGKCENLFGPADNFDPRHSSQNEKGRCYSFPKFLIIQDEKFN